MGLGNGLSSSELLRTIADVLDIRTVFHRVSEIASKTLPHDALAMVFVDRGRHYVHQAKWPADFPDPPSVTFKTPLPDEYIIADVSYRPVAAVRTRGRVPFDRCSRVSLVAGREDPGS